MMIPDATTLALLEAQLRHLTAVLDRLAAARDELVPAKATFVWHGEARAAYDRSVAALAGEIGSALDLLVLARQNTVAALAEEARRV